MDERLQDRLRTFKEAVVKSSLQVRREEFLRLQQRSRQNQAANLRKLLSQTVEQTSSEVNETSSSSAASLSDYSIRYEDLDSSVISEAPSESADGELDEDPTVQTSSSSSCSSSSSSSTGRGRGSLSSRAPRKSKSDAARQQRDFFARQLMLPEWMVDIPEDLHSEVLQFCHELTYEYEFRF
jgi:hypothetical protein